MRFMKAGMVLGGALMAAALVTAGGAQAVSKLNAPSIGSTVELAKAKKAKAKAKKTGPGYCGTMKYWDKKKKACADATAKK
jgi:hypothetical protein